MLDEKDIDLVSFLIIGVIDLEVILVLLYH